MVEEHPPAAQAAEDPLLNAVPSPAPLVGTWAATGEVLGDDGDVVGTLTGTDTYRWLGPTVVHEVDVHVDVHVDGRVDGRRTQALEVLEPYDAARGAFPTRAYDDAGGVDVSTATVDADGVWTFRARGARATLEVAPDGASMRATWVRETATGDVPWMRLRWTRTG